jgi:hypothetical protein
LSTLFELVKAKPDLVRPPQMLVWCNWLLTSL